MSIFLFGMLLTISSGIAYVFRLYMLLRQSGNMRFANYNFIPFPTGINAHHPECPKELIVAYRQKCLPFVYIGLLGVAILIFAPRTIPTSPLG